MSVWLIVLFLGVAGAAGGLLNAYFAHEGFIWPKTEALPDGQKIWRPGFFGNVLSGAMTAIVLAVLYSPLGAVPLLDAQDAAMYSLTLGGLVGAFLSGMGGARLLKREVAQRFEEATRKEVARTVRTMRRKLRK